ncbi:MAG: type II toxin-antitoxin system RelE/ParE family toxin [Kiritimatiellae bacterium]|nr:type II toxin-antitoxin system RelE/ParE family toxin [Kiritimatiellia bacterium]
MRVRWSPLAVARVSEIAEYIARDNPIAAERWAISVFDRVKQVRDFSKSGRHVPEIIRKDIGELVHGNFRIIYRIERQAVSILTVRHFKQILPLEDIDRAWE